MGGEPSRKAHHKNRAVGSNSVSCSRLSLEHQSRWVDRVQMGPWRLSSAVLTFPKGNEKPPKPQRRKVMGLDLHFRERKSLWPQYQEQIQDYVR